MVAGARAACYKAAEVAVEKILVDGYNLLYKDGALKNLAERSLESAREQLLASLVGYRTSEMEITVVFDGQGAKSQRCAAPGVTVRFSRYPETADEVILEIIGKERRRGSLTVVTSDKKHIGRAARAEGVRWISSETFLRRLSRDRREKGVPGEKPISTSPEELEYWLQRFGPEEQGKKK